MKKSGIVLISLTAILLVVIITWLRFSGAAGVADIRLSGATGTAFTGYYVQGGQRVAVAGMLPLWLHHDGITEFEFRKVHPRDLIIFTAHYGEVVGAQAMQSCELAPGTIGIRGRVNRRGLTVKTF